MLHLLHTFAICPLYSIYFFVQNKLQKRQPNGALIISLKMALNDCQEYNFIHHITGCFYVATYHTYAIMHETPYSDKQTLNLRS